MFSLSFCIYCVDFCIIFDIEVYTSIVCIFRCFEVISGHSGRAKARAQKGVSRRSDMKLTSLRNLTKMAISEATLGVRRPMSTTFVDIFKGYNAVVYTKIKF